MRSVAWKRNKKLPFIHICTGVSQQEPFHKMLESFLMKHNYSNWYKKHPHTSLQLPSKSLGASYAEKVMLNGSSIWELVKQSTSLVLTSELEI